jgi:hypothetical protein
MSAAELKDVSKIWGTSQYPPNDYQSLGALYVQQKTEGFDRDGDLDDKGMCVVGLHHVYDSLLGADFGNGGHHIMQALHLYGEFSDVRFLHCNHDNGFINYWDTVDQIWEFLNTSTTHCSCMFMMGIHPGYVPNQRCN